MNYKVFCATKAAGLAEMFQKNTLWKLAALVHRWDQMLTKLKLKASVLLFTVILTIATKEIPCPGLRQRKPV